MYHLPQKYWWWKSVIHMKHMSSAGYVELRSPSTWCKWWKHSTYFLVEYMHVESYLIVKQPITVLHQIRGNKRDDNMIKVDIKWEESFIACGESDLIEEILKNTCGIRRRQKNICVETECTAIFDNNWINITVQFSN